MHVPRGQRGVIATALVLAIVLLGVAVSAASVLASSQISLASLRAENLRATAACDAGLQLALAEISAWNDSDGDGTIGGISDNGIDADDPAFDGASCRARRVEGLITVTGVCGSAQHVLTFDLGPSDPLDPKPKRNNGRHLGWYRGKGNSATSNAGGNGNAESKKNGNGHAGGNGNGGGQGSGSGHAGGNESGNNASNGGAKNGKGKGSH
ncbi:MAG: hypothetical protein DYG92_04755 [Leptolyngbya sp. PLA1]|nr:hypothetical protein [Leptolyngbya sp. PLA1]